ncbi:MAG: His/Gly/Thr/Pro-type tRNA ligase C-terminal domain-containing protein, partial [Candidatus Staskawiczbacteria bacterium]|nr:His/Gly/Thr/Pro-type tRNA ligase C-terminal domain-containing protein [Candidatus Staskawiczbacteria bacterium]
VSNEKHLEYAQKLGSELAAKGARVWVDATDESVGKKIRNSEHQKIPYTLVIGDKEMGGAQLAVRERGKKETMEMSEDELVAKLKRA